jgi:hypothetical protein
VATIGVMRSSQSVICLSHITYHISHITYHISHITYHISHISYLISLNLADRTWFSIHHDSNDQKKIVNWEMRTKGFFFLNKCFIQWEERFIHEISTPFCSQFTHRKSLEEKISEMRYVMCDMRYAIDKSHIGMISLRLSSPDVKLHHQIQPTEIGFGGELSSIRMNS